MLSVEDVLKGHETAGEDDYKEVLGELVLGDSPFCLGFIAMGVKKSAKYG